jgi:hypothetical protein
MKKLLKTVNKLYHKGAFNKTKIKESENNYVYLNVYCKNSSIVLDDVQKKKEYKVCNDVMYNRYVSK